MKRIYCLVTLLFPFYVGYVIYNDFQRPETWSDWQCDPRLYLPVLAAEFVVIAFLLWRAARAPSKSQRGS